MWHYLGGPPSRQPLCLFWRETRQKVWSRDLDATGSRKGTPVRSWTKERGEFSWRRATKKGSWQSTPDSRRDQSDEIGSSSSEGRPVKMSQHSSRFVEFSLEIHASVSLQGMQCHNLTFLHLCWPNPYGSFVLCSFSPTPLIVFLVP